MKNIRQNEILKIIQARDIDTQEQLLEELRARGFTTTQATISRDIKELRLVKELTGTGGYRYAQSDRKTASTADARLRNNFKEGVISVEIAQNIVVVRTMPGLASAACSALDNMNLSEIVGSLAGDDTAFLVMRDAESAAAFCEEIKEIL